MSALDPSAPGLPLAGGGGGGGGAVALTGDTTGSGTGLPLPFRSAMANTARYNAVSSKPAASPRLRSARIAGASMPSSMSMLRNAASVAPGLFIEAPGVSRSPSRTSFLPLAIATACWKAALRLACQPALKSANRYSGLS